MWPDANVNISQQRIIEKHLMFHFGKRLLIPVKCFVKIWKGIMFLLPMETTNFAKMESAHNNQRKNHTGQEIHF
jgi:hypothetical protein